MAQQSALGLRTSILPGRDVWVYGRVSGLNALAAVFDGIASNGGVALLERHAAGGDDLLIFQGRSTPFTFPDYRRLKQRLRRCPSGHEVTWEARPETPEDWKDGEWKWDDQLTVRSDGNGALVAGSPLGLRYCALGALRIAEWQGSHTHIFFPNTGKSVEMTISYDDEPAS